MKKHKTMEVLAILSLSLVLTSTLSISGIIPDLLVHFENYSRSSVELIVSVTSIATTIMVGLNPFVSKFLSERATIILGLLVIGFAGIIPFFFMSYPIILLSRIFVGIGVGLLNTRAISIIGERFTGSVRSKLLGFRGSAETLGQTVLNMIAGQLMVISWNSSFLIYAIAFFILMMYLLFVPKVETEEAKESEKESKKGIKLNGKQLVIVLLHALFICLLISITVSSMLRIPSLMVETGVGTTLQANRVLSVYMFSGFISGVLFGHFIQIFKEYILPLFLVITSVGLAMIALSATAFLLGIGAFLVGFSLTICVVWVFNNLSNTLPREILNTANSFVLVGSNLGAATAPLVLGGIGLINPSLKTSFLVHAFLLIVVAIGLFLFYKNEK
ncbi:MFS transporter [Vagococcus sp.]|uniref:MFS transporter n=1 Tax=Vagococcus sp. TaxID=1933889 RepID=UPI003F99CF34